MPAPSKCARCDGDGGWAEDTSSGGVTRRTWRQCRACNGTGEQS